MHMYSHKCRIACIYDVISIKLPKIIRYWISSKFNEKRNITIHWHNINTVTSIQYYWSSCNGIWNRQTHSTPMQFIIIIQQRQLATQLHTYCKLQPSTFGSSISYRSPLLLHYHRSVVPMKAHTLQFLFILHYYTFLLLNFTKEVFIHRLLYSQVLLDV